MPLNLVVELALDMNINCCDGYLTWDVLHGFDIIVHVFYVFSYHVDVDSVWFIKCIMFMLMICIFNDYFVSKLNFSLILIKLKL